MLVPIDFLLILNDILSPIPYRSYRRLSFKFWRGGLRGDTHCSSRFIGKLVVDFQFLLVIIELNFFARCYG